MRVSARDSRNLAALLSAQAANALFPLLVAPYLLHVGGFGVYARFAVSEAIAMGLLTLGLYSFDLDAMSSVVGKKPHEYRSDVSVAFSEVLYARLGIFMVSTIVSIFVIAIVDPDLLAYHWGWVLYVLAQLLLSAWMYQGLERNWFTAWPVVLSRLISIVCIVSLVHSEVEITRVPMLVGVVSLIFSAGLVVFAHYRLGIQLRKVPVARIIWRLRRGWTVFLGCASVYLYRDVNVVILGGVSFDPAAVSAYSIAEKVAKGVQSAIRPINQLFMPKAILVLKPYGAPGRHVWSGLSRLIWPQVVLVGVGMLLVLSALVTLVQWRPDLASSLGIGRSLPLMLVMAPVVVIGAVNFMFGSVGLNNLAASRYLLFATIATGFANLLLCTQLSMLIGETGASISFVLSEAFLCILILRRYFE